MNDLMLFVLKSVVVSGILTGWYMLALRNKRLHHYNRFFLLFTLYASIQIPLLHFTWSPVLEKTSLLLNPVQIIFHTPQGVAQEARTAPSYPGGHIDLTQIASGIAALLSLALLARMLIRIVRVLRLRRQYPISIADGVTMVYTNLPDAPFSFLNCIFWKDSISLESGYGQLMLQHELAHVRQKHSYDKLACQLLSSVFWMNPFYWMIQREINMVHEFLADERAIVQSGDIREEDYTETLAKMLLQKHNGNSYLTPEHHFFSSPIQRRILMLQSNSTVRASLLMRIAALPLVAGSVFLVAFSPKTATPYAAAKTDHKIILLVDAGHGGADEGSRSGTLSEKMLTLKVARRMEQLSSRYPIKVHLTRSGDQLMSIEERIALSNKLQPDDFISIHIGGQTQGGKDQSSLDIAVNVKNAKAEESKKLAYAILKNASRPEWLQNNTFSERNSYAVLSNTAASALIEIGSINNQEQMQYIEDDKKLDELCSHILEGVLEAHR